MSDYPPSLIIDLTGADDVDADDLERMSRQLRAELLDLDLPVDTVEFEASGPETAEYNKGAGGLAALGVLLVRFVARSDVLAGIVGTVRGWLERGRPGTVKMTLDGDTLEISGRPSAEQSRLIDLWVSRHARTS